MVYNISLSANLVLFEVKTEIVQKQKRTTTTLYVSSLSIDDFEQILEAFQGKGNLQYYKDSHILLTVSLNGCLYHFSTNYYHRLLESFAEKKVKYATFQPVG